MPTRAGEGLGARIGCIEQLGKPPIGRLGQQRPEIPDDLGSGQVGVGRGHGPTLPSRLRAHSLWCMTSARAVKPERSKKFFASRAPGSA